MGTCLGDLSLTVPPSSPTPSGLWPMDPLSPHQIKKKCKSLTPSDKIYWIRACKQCHVWSGSKLFDTDGTIRWVFNIYIGSSSSEAVVSRLID